MTSIESRGGKESLNEENERLRKALINYAAHNVVVACGHNKGREMAESLELIDRLGTAKELKAAISRMEEERVHSGSIKKQIGLD